MNTRFDVRSKKNFIKDIKIAHKREAQIAARLAIKVHSQTGEWPELVGNGVGYDGKFIENDKEITAEPDFIIGGRKVEITCSRNVCNKIFHQKSNKIHKMIADGTDMVFVNGFESQKEPNYIWLNHLEWTPFIQKAKDKYGIVPILGGGSVGFLNKNGYRFDTYWFDKIWQKLPVLIKGLPNEYKEILNSFGD